MASSSLDREAGFATPAAAGVALAISIVAAAVGGMSVASLKVARADLERTRAEYALSGVAQQAALDLMQARGAQRMAWTAPDGVTVLAEPEGGKLAVERAAALGDADLKRLGATDPDRTRQLLSELAAADTLDTWALSAAGGSALWRRCAASAISLWGSGSSLLVPAAVTVTKGEMNWRTAEVWRLRLAGQGGWLDDRIVRFTGDPKRPVAVVARDFRRGGKEETACDAPQG